MRFLFVFGCDGFARILPGGLIGGAAGTGSVTKIIEFVLAEIKKIVSCRSTEAGVQFTDEIFNIRYGLEGLLYYMTTGVTSLNIPTSFDDWTGALSNISSHITLPSTCTYAYWVQNGACSVQYSGIKSLLGLDITLRARIRRCTASTTPGSMEAYIGCMGKDCFLFKEIRLCSGQSDCTESTVCSNIINEIANNTNNNNNNNNNNQSGSNCNNGTCDVSQSQSSSVNSVVLLTPAFIYATLKENTTCMSDIISEIGKDAKNAVRALNGMALDNTYNQIFMCTFDTSYIKDSSSTAAWAQSQVIVDANVISLRDLSSWTVSTGQLQYETGNSTGSGVRSVLLSLMMLAVIVLFI